MGAHPRPKAFATALVTVAQESLRYRLKLDFSAPVLFLSILQQHKAHRLFEAKCPITSPVTKQKIYNNKNIVRFFI